MDLIDRDALEPFYESGTDPNDTYADMTYIRAEHIENAPAVNRWIPCRERMPDSIEGIIFTVDRGHPFVCVGYRINNERKGLQRWFDKLSGLNFSDYDVKAWVPMPDAYEPPKEGDDHA